MPDDARLDLEFGWTDWWSSCRDPHPSFRECRRLRGHDGPHASGFGASRMRWGGESA